MSINRFDQRYLIVASGFVIQGVIIGCMFAYGVFFKVFETELGWSRTLLSGCTSLSFIVMGILAIYGGRASDRFGPRWVLSFTGLCFGLGLGLMYFMSSPWQLYALYGVMVGIGLSTHDVVTLSSIARWFNTRRGTMTGVVKVGTACGQIGIPLLATVLITSVGWRMACALLGAGAVILLVIAAQGMRPHPDPSATLKTVPQKPPGTPPDDHLGISYQRAVRSRQLWTLCAVQFMFFPSLVTIPVHVAVHGTDLGMGASSAAAILSTIGGASILGRLSVGALVDSIGGRRAFLVCLVALFFSLLWLRTIEQPSMLYMFAGLYGFAHGGLFTVVSPTIAEFFGMMAHGQIFGTIVFFGTLGGALGPLLAGSIFDMTGSYQIAFTTLTVMAFFGVVLIYSLRPLSSSDNTPQVTTRN